MNKLLNHILEKRNGHYCHAVGVNDEYEITDLFEAIIEEQKTKFDLETYIDFFESMSIIALDPLQEKYVHDVSHNIREVVTEIYEGINLCV